MKENLKTLIISLFIIVAVCLPLSMFAGASEQTWESVSGEETTDEAEYVEAVFEYEITSPGVKITGLNEDFRGDLVIPAYIDGYNVYSLGYNAFKNHTGIKNVTFESGADCSASGIFYGCTSLESVVFANGTKEVGSYMFYGCTALKSVVLPASVTTIADNAIKQSVIENVIIPADSSLESIGHWAFYQTPLKNIDLPESLKTIGSYAFYETAVQSVYLGKNVNSVGYEAFYRTQLTEVSINSDCASWHSAIFELARALETVTLSDDVTAIPQGMFSGCVNLKAVYGGKNITVINNSAFYACSSLEYFEFGENVEKIGNSVFAKCSSIAKLPFSDKITQIGYQSFLDWTSLSGELVLPDSLESLGSGIFWGCTGITSAVFPESITDIPDTMFYECTSFADVTFDGNIKSIGSHSFASTALTQVVLEDGIETIGKWAFKDCENLTVIELPETLISIEEAAFQNHKCNKIVVPSSLEYIGALVFNSSTRYEVFFLSYDCEFCTSSTTTVTYCPFGGATTVYGYSGSSAETYLSGVHNYTSYLHEHDYGDLCALGIHAPEKECAFAASCLYCSESVCSHSDEDGDGLCDTCTLSVSEEQDVYIEYVNSVLTVYGTAIFDGNFADTFSEIASECKTIVFADGFESVDENVFANFTALEFVYIPESMKTVGAGAFSGCESIKNVIVLSDSVTVTNAFDSDGFNMLVSSSLNDVPDNVNVIYTSFADGVLYFDGSLTADLYDLFDITSLYALTYGGIMQLHFEHFEAVDFTVFEYNTSEYTGLDQTVFDNVNFTVHAFVDGEYTQIAFESMHDMLNDGYDGTFYLTVETGNEDVIYDDTQISVGDSFRQMIQRILSAIVQLLNKLFAFFRRR